MRKIFFLFLAFILFGGISAVSFPNGFYGSAKFSNNTNIDGEIVAKINNQIVSSAEIVDGFYDMVVQSDNIDTIFFYIDGEFIEDIEFGYSGEIRELNFVIQVSDSSVNFSNNSNSGNFQTEKTKNIGFKQIGNFCEPNWKCSEWEDCVNKIKERKCSDLNNCGVDYRKPFETTGCENSEIMKTESSNFGIQLGVGIFSGLLIILIIIFLFGL